MKKQEPDQFRDDIFLSQIEVPALSKIIILTTSFIVVIGITTTQCSSNPLESDTVKTTPLDSIATLSFTDQSSALLPVNDLRFNSMDMESADINKDGYPDIIIAMEYQRNIILINDSTGKFINRSEHLFSPWPVHDSEDIAISDFNSDGRLDLYFATEDDITDEYYLQSLDGKFILSNDLIPRMSTSNAVLSIDINNDEAPDLILGNQGQNYMFLNQGDGSFKDVTKERLPISKKTTQDIEAGDINGDGYVDLIFANEQNNEVLINNGLGFFNDSTDKFLSFPNLNEETREADLGDIDGDGDLDLFFANVLFQVGEYTFNRLLVNKENKFFEEADGDVFEKNSNNISVDIDFADIDNDGDLDIFIANGFGTPQKVFANLNGKFINATSKWLPENLNTFNAIDVEVLDINGDGKLDIYYSVFQGSDVVLIQD